ncbi:hypothetical protein E4U43_007026 [Claviceps pusilla]|uniref:Uncharacterized protein n=1 Tax=Claviceps pusilla TaxID=123648 RepID=A0A9P7NFE1_9HYPO|nr:hypothetical protein E4U43_007026 [Claviceps pusilla]
MPSPPSHDIREASSSTAAEKALSGLRARLRSEDCGPFQEPANPPVGPENHVYAKLQAIFSQNLSGQADSSTNLKFQDLAELFALYGQEIYNLSLKAVQAAHEAISDNISAFHAQAASTSAHTALLYNNISYPLSATLCQSETFPSASLARHVRTLHKRLSVAEAELARLNDEWKRCAAEEAQILSDRAGASAEKEDGGATKKKMEELVARIDDIVQRRTGEIEELNEEYRDLLWAESNRMMQAMMAD